MCNLYLFFHTKYIVVGMLEPRPSGPFAVPPPVLLVVDPQEESLYCVRQTPHYLVISLWPTKSWPCAQSFIATLEENNRAFFPGTALLLKKVFSVSSCFLRHFQGWEGGVAPEPQPNEAAAPAGLDFCNVQRTAKMELRRAPTQTCLL